MSMTLLTYEKSTTLFPLFSFNNLSYQFVWDDMRNSMEERWQTTKQFDVGVSQPARVLHIGSKLHVDYTRYFECVA